MTKFNISEFKDRYINNHEEFCLIYKNMKIEYFCERICYPVVIQYDNGEIKQFEFSSPEEALEKMKFSGKSIDEIWNGIE